MTKSYNEIQFEKVTKAYALIETIEKAANDLEVSFDELSNLLSVPHNRPEFADYVPSSDCKYTYFDAKPTGWNTDPDATSVREIQSFTLFNIVLLKLDSENEGSVWLPLNELPATAANAKAINNLFENAWANITPIDMQELQQLIDLNDLNDLKYDSGLEFRRALRNKDGDRYTLPVRILDEIWRLPKVITTAQIKLANFLNLINNIVPTNHQFLRPSSYLQQATREEINYEGSRGAITKAQRSNAHNPASTNQQPPAAN
jgi:hypothetical protein